MITREKIEQWIKEVEQRPSSAPPIIQNLAARLRYLTQRNEELLDENISLTTGKRVEEYERRIAHLEYQLDLLKRQLGGEITAGEIAAIETTIGREQTAVSPQAEISSVMVYDAQGHVFRFQVNQQTLSSGERLAQMPDELTGRREPPRMLAVPSSDELLLVFSSGRVTALPVEQITHQLADQPLSMDQAALPDEPRGGESLVCVVPISELPLADFLIQVSRKGYIKKINASMTESILANRYIGSGVILPADQTFNVALCRNEDQLMLVSHLGYLLRIQALQLTYAIDEAMRLGKSDHLVSAFRIFPSQSVLIVTEGGKLIHRTEDSFELANSFKTRGKPVYSQSRREQGVRVIGAAALNEQDWGAALHKDGLLTVHSMADISASGTLRSHSGLLAFAPLLRPRSNSRPSSED